MTPLGYLLIGGTVTWLIVMPVISILRHYWHDWTDRNHDST